MRRFVCVPEVDVEHERRRGDLHPLGVHVVLDVGDPPVAQVVGRLGTARSRPVEHVLVGVVVAADGPHRLHLLLGAQGGIDLQDHLGHACVLLPMMDSAGTTSGRAPTALRRTPMPCTSSSTTSPGSIQRSSSRPQPRPTVPLPRRSPGRSGCSWDRCGDDLGERVEHRAEPALGPGLAVHARRHARRRDVDLVGRRHARPDRAREVLAQARAEADLHLAELDVARAPVVEDRVARDRAPPPPRRSPSTRAGR